MSDWKLLSILQKGYCSQFNLVKINETPCFSSWSIVTSFIGNLLLYLSCIQRWWWVRMSWAYWPNNDSTVNPGAVCPWSTWSRRPPSSSRTCSGRRSPRSCSEEWSGTRWGHHLEVCNLKIAMCCLQSYGFISPIIFHRDSIKKHHF